MLCIKFWVTSPNGENNFLSCCCVVLKDNPEKMKRSKREREGVELDNPKENCSRDRAFVFSERAREGGDMQRPSTFQSRETRG